MNHKSDNLVQLLKKELAQAGLSTEVRAQKAGCLDVCEYGPALVVYPDQVWYGGVKQEDISEIVQSHIKEGRIVERLRIPGK